MSFVEDADIINFVKEAEKLNNSLGYLVIKAKEVSSVQLTDEALADLEKIDIEEFIKQARQKQVLVD